MEQMPDEVPDHQGGHYKGSKGHGVGTVCWSYSLGWSQRRGGNNLHKADLSQCTLQEIHLDDIKASDTPDEGGAWVHI